MLSVIRNYDITFMVILYLLAETKEKLQNLM